jgi:Family of unknown function (DUF5681)
VAPAIPEGGEGGAISEKDKCMKSAESAAGKQRGRPFRPGRSGNPKGRPFGQRNKATLLAEQLLDSQAEQLIGKAVELALKGDAVCIRMLIERLIPVRRDRPCPFNLPDIKNITDARALMTSVLEAVSTGSLTPAEAADVGKLATLLISTYQAEIFEERLEALESTQ